jgi:hypothetical protein
MTDIVAKLDAIEAGLDGVTPGPWRRYAKSPHVSRDTTRPDPHPETGSVLIAECGDYRDKEIAPYNMDRWLADAAHIARLDPDTVRELVRLARIGADAPAIRAAALEEAAKVAEQKFRIDQIRRDRMLDEEWEQDRETAGDEIAAAIRALKDTP